MPTKRIIFYSKHHTIKAYTKKGVQDYEQNINKYVIHTGYHFHFKLLFLVTIHIFRWMNARRFKLPFLSMNFNGCDVTCIECAVPVESGGTLILKLRIALS